MASKYSFNNPVANNDGELSDQIPGWPSSNQQPSQPIKKLQSHQPRPSSSTDGFFQTPPPILNQLQDDIALQRALKLFLPQSVLSATLQEITAFGDFVLSKPVLDLVADAEKNLPYLKTWSSWGRRQDELITSEGWRKLSAIGIKEGMVSIGYENKYFQFSRPYQFCKYLVWTGSSAWTTCPNLMTDGVASLLQRHLCDSELKEQTRKAMQSAYDHLTSRDPDIAWSTGQWMTERQGGSDVSQTETLATYAPDLSPVEAESSGTDGVPLGPWLCNGFKWFSSATDSSMMVFLARTTKGISTFMAPMRRTIPKSNNISPTTRDVDTELNGIQIQRLKNKLGTKALPTAELVLKDVRAYLIGEEGRGTKEIATVLNVARVHNAITAIGFWGRGLSTIRAFARVRKVGLKPLWMKSAFTRTLARMHVEYKANVLFCIFVSSLLGVTEQAEIGKYRSATNSKEQIPPSPSSTHAIPNPKAAEHLFRLLASVLKGLTAKSAIAGLAECMECMGGVGYLENDDMQFNIARQFRDVNVCSIWEGTTDMMSHDLLRVVFGKTSNEIMKAMDDWVAHVVEVSSNALPVDSKAIEVLWKQWRHFIESRDQGEIELRSREVMEKLGDVIKGALLVLDASRDGDNVAVDVVRAWLEERGLGPTDSNETGRWRKAVTRDKRIVFGNEDPEATRSML